MCIYIYVYKHIDTYTNKKRKATAASKLTTKSFLLGSDVQS